MRAGRGWGCDYKLLIGTAFLLLKPESKGTAGVPDLPRPTVDRLKRKQHMEDECTGVRRRNPLGVVLGGV